MLTKLFSVSAEETNGMKLRVLIVDADQGACESVQAAMSASNLEAVMETSSSRAAEFLRQEKYDAMFLELNMPAPDGLQLAKMARGSGMNRRTPIIMLSGQNSPEAMSKAFEAGANFFLFKPFDRSRLMRVWRAAHGPIEANSTPPIAGAAIDAIVLRRPRAPTSAPRASGLPSAAKNA